MHTGKRVHYVQDIHDVHCVLGFTAAQSSHGSFVFPTEDLLLQLVLRKKQSPYPLKFFPKVPKSYNLISGLLIHKVL